MLSPFSGHVEIQVHPADSRKEYRNRIQVHYDLNRNQFGFNSPIQKKLIAVPQCQLPIRIIQEKLHQLYQNDQWKHLIKKDQPRQGHIEIYYREEQLQISVNKDYADGGFTQVNQSMNKVLKEKLLDFFIKYHPKTILDLFGGNGNLTNYFDQAQVLVVDNFQSNPELMQPWQQFRQVNLYKEQQWQPFLKSVSHFDLLLCDPPRSGIKHLDLVIEKVKPKQLCYVSCNPSTMIRDMRAVKNYKLTEAHLLDLFPGTHHFESITFFERE